jgi:hypothetical protein
MNFDVSFRRSPSDEVAVRVPWPLSVSLFDGKSRDEARAVTIEIGNHLRLECAFSEDVGGDHDVHRIMMAAILMLGVQHGDEIREAVAAEKLAANTL